MRLKKLHLLAFGPFTNHVLDFGDRARGLVVIFGPNEAGKSSVLRAISDLRFGIHSQSKDNFVHAHPDMRVGGEFVDRNDNVYSLLRRKGRGATLLSAHFDLGGITSDTPVPPEVEAMLTCGLTQSAYDAMFSLDHRRLREGGEALLKGEGDVGAALFEASAGVRSIPHVLNALDNSSRKFFMPGARGKNARINEAIKTYNDQHAEFRRTLVRPAHWTELFKNSQDAIGHLAELDSRRRQLNGKLLSIKELRAVAPLLSTLDNAVHTLEMLSALPLLSLTSATERVTAESGLVAAEHNASIATEEVTRQQEILDGLILDEEILALDNAIRRIAASAESIDQHRRDIADANVDVEAESDSLTNIAKRIDFELAREDVLAKVRGKAQKVNIGQLFRSVDLAQQALEQHIESKPKAEDSNEIAETKLPSDEARTTLRVAQAEVARADLSLKRLAKLPVEIKASRRAVSTAIEALGLENERSLEGIHPLLDAQIDTAIKDQNANETRRDGIQERITNISNALPVATNRLEQLLVSGMLATRDDVDNSRATRDSGWALVRGVYIDGTNPEVGHYAIGVTLAQAYEEAVSRADRLVDDLASDTERATQVQACKRELQTLERDRDELEGRLRQLVELEAIRRSKWDAALLESTLPALPPAALRDWQALLPVSREAIEKLQSKLDELDELQEFEMKLAAVLRSAIAGTGLSAPDDAMSLSTLSALAGEIDETIKIREAAINKAAGKEVEQKRQYQQWAAQEGRLRSELQLAQKAIQPIFSILLLPEDASIAVARARLDEFDELADVKAKLTAAEMKRARASQALSVIVESAKSIWTELGDAEPEDLRLYLEQIKVRLDQAEIVQQSRNLAQQARDKSIKDKRDHEETVSRHRASLFALCAAAGVQSADLLPEAEEQSRRKREAQAEVDRALNQLAHASRRQPDELRALLVNQDAASMDADEDLWTAEQIQIEERIQIARQREEETRRDLESIDSSDAAAAARDAMERALASIRASISPWIRTKLATALLAEALKGFRERAQGPMLRSASDYFARMTQGGFSRLLSDVDGEEPILIAQRSNGSQLRVEGMSEGTRDQLYLALRLAALDIRRESGVELPVILDDILMTSDEERSGAMFEALAEFARDNQVLIFTHHRHIADMAVRHVRHESLTLVSI